MVSEGIFFSYDESFVGSEGTFFYRTVRSPRGAIILCVSPSPFHLLTIMSTLDKPYASDPRIAVTIPSQSMLTVVSNLTRWKILREMIGSEPIMVKDLSQRVGESEGVVSKHMGVLRSAGLVKSGAGRLYRIAEAYQPAPGSREIDLGFAVLRFPAA